jgi:hypothetical protein
MDMSDIQRSEDLSKSMIPDPSGCGCYITLDKSNARDLI